MSNRESKLAEFKGQLVWIEICLFLTACIILFLALFGSFRRRCYSGLFKILVWVSYVLSTTSVIYTLGQMQTSSINHRIFSMWAAFLFVLHGSGVSVSAYSLEDNEQWLRFLWRIVLKIIWLALLITLYDTTSRHPKFMLPIFFLLVVTLLKTSERIRAFKLARRAGLARNTRFIAHFMGYEHELSNQQDEFQLDPTPMKGYNYLVRGEDKKMVQVTPPHYYPRLEINDEVITVHKIWECKGRLLTRDPDDQLKDLCLSFALFRLICRRFAGFPLWECIRCLDKTWNFVRHELLSKDDDYERPFRVIEVELSFLFDRFYTKYPVIFQPRQLRWKIIELIFIIIGCLSAAKAASNYNSRHSIHIKEINMDTLVTAIVIFVVLSFQVGQIFLIIFSDWAKVSLICNYVQKPSWQESKYIEIMIEFICRGRWLKPWGRKIAQYSLLSSSNRKPCRLLYNCLTSNFFDSPGEGRKGSTRIKLPPQVKKAIIHSLKINGPKLRNGTASLSRNGVKTELISWVSKPESTVHVIMVWHIATSLCEVASSKSVSLHQRENFIVATSLSKYCAYLVAFAPRFLPHNAYLSEFLFNQIVKETGEFFKKCKSVKGRYETMMSLRDEGDSRETVIKRSAALGQYLIHEIESEELRWKILAEFWAEIMLFVAPSDDVTVHVEYLAQGGEFITHLWALLSHAGILKQDLPEEI